MGPASGLLLAVFTAVLWGILTFYGVAIDRRLELAFFVLLIMNVIYSVLNLVPIWPLDGGQLVLTMLDYLSPRHGVRRTHIFSFLVAATVAALAAVWGQMFYLAIIMGYFAFMNYVLLSHYHRIAMAEHEGS